MKQKNRETEEEKKNRGPGLVDLDFILVGIVWPWREIMMIHTQIHTYIHPHPHTHSLESKYLSSIGIVLVSSIQVGIGLFYRVYDLAGCMF